MNKLHFCTSAQSSNKSEFLIYAFILKNLNKSTEIKYLLVVAL